jgi:hypothetical protein
MIEMNSNNRIDGFFFLLTTGYWLLLTFAFS